MEIAFEHQDFTLYAKDGDTELGHLVLDASDDLRPTVSFVYVERDFRRKGVSVALYHEASKRLSEMGLKLYAGKFQHEDSLAVWNKMQTLTPDRIGEESGRRYLSYL